MLKVPKIEVSACWSQCTTLISCISPTHTESSKIYLQAKFHRFIPPEIILVKGMMQPLVSKLLKVNLRFPNSFVFWSRWTASSYSWLPRQCGSPSTSLWNWLQMRYMTLQKLMQHEVHGKKYDLLQWLYNNLFLALLYYRIHAPKSKNKPTKERRCRCESKVLHISMLTERYLCT